MHMNAAAPMKSGVPGRALPPSPLSPFTHYTSREGNVAISYSGFGAQITDSLEDALIALSQGKEPKNEPFSSGTIDIRPVGVIGNFSSGNFSIVADDIPAQLLPYRFLVTTQLDSPCKTLQD